jgi:hypothetical protein
VAFDGIAAVQAITPRHSRFWELPGRDPLVPISSPEEKTIVKVFQTATLIVITACTLAACESGSKVPVAQQMGPDPKLPPPNKTLIPTINTAGDEVGGGGYYKREPHYPFARG